MTCAKRHNLDKRSVETWKRKRKMTAHECGHSKSERSYTTSARTDCQWQHGAENKGGRRAAIIRYNGQAGVATVSVTSGQHDTQTETNCRVIRLTTLNQVSHYLLLMECWRHYLLLPAVLPKQLLGSKDLIIFFHVIHFSTFSWDVQKVSPDCQKGRSHKKV
jgi:hypothetical protein